MICIAKIHNLGKPGNSNLCNSHACFEAKISLNKNNGNEHIERQNCGVQSSSALTVTESEVTTARRCQ